MYNKNKTILLKYRCYDAKLYEAAKTLFISIKNNAKIASCLVRLG